MGNVLLLCPVSNAANFNAYSAIIVIAVVALLAGGAALIYFFVLKGGATQLPKWAMSKRESKRESRRAAWDGLDGACSIHTHSP